MLIHLQNHTSNIVEYADEEILWSMKLLHKKHKMDFTKDCDE